jgi:hypothetical protein
MTSYLILGCICAFLYGVTMFATTFPVTLDKKLGATIRSHSSQLKYLQNQAVQSNSALVSNGIQLTQQATQLAATSAAATAAQAAAANALPITGGTVTGNLVVNGNHTVPNGYLSVGGGTGNPGDIINSGTVHTGGVSAPGGTVVAESATTTADISVGGTAHTAGVSNSGTMTTNTIVVQGGEATPGASPGLISGGMPTPSGNALLGDQIAFINDIANLANDIVFNLANQNIFS